MTVGRAMDELDTAEFILWCAHLEMSAEEAEDRADEMKRNR